MHAPGGRCNCVSQLSTLFDHQISSCPVVVCGHCDVHDDGNAVCASETSSRSSRSACHRADTCAASWSHVTADLVMRRAARLMSSLSLRIAGLISHPARVRFVLPLKKPRRHLRSANRHLLAVPRFPLNTYGRRAFSVAGPMAWNSLPDFIRDPTSSTDCFRRLLKTYLFARYYSASSALVVLNYYALYRSTHSLSHSYIIISKFDLP